MIPLQDSVRTCPTLSLRRRNLARSRMSCPWHDSTASSILDRFDRADFTEPRVGSPQQHSPHTFDSAMCVWLPCTAKCAHLRSCKTKPIKSIASMVSCKSLTVCQLENAPPISRTSLDPAPALLVRWPFAHAATQGAQLLQKMLQAPKHLQGQCPGFALGQAKREGKITLETG